MKSKLLIFVVIVAVIFTGTYVFKQQNSKKTEAAKNADTVAQNTPNSDPAETNPCKLNTGGKVVFVDTAKRHLWACTGTTKSYDSAVITGYDGLASTITPVGTYEIYDKLTEQTLTGSDEKGSWNELAHYWEPFLSNKYGVYGFHDATWRNSKEFGTIPTTSKDASHGCIELPLAAMKWFAEWSEIGTTLVVT